MAEVGEKRPHPTEDLPEDILEPAKEARKEDK